MNESVMSEPWSIFLRGVGRLSFVSWISAQQNYSSILREEGDRLTSVEISSSRIYIHLFDHLDWNRVVSLCSNLLVVNFAGKTSVRSKARWIEADSEDFHQDDKSILIFEGAHLNLTSETHMSLGQNLHSQIGVV
jgi:hypothetical protein